MTSPRSMLPRAFHDETVPAPRSEILTSWFLLAVTFALLAAAYRAGLAAGLDTYIGPHSGGQFLNGICVVATKWLTGLGNYVCLSEVNTAMTNLGLAPAGPSWPGFLADRGFLDEALRQLFNRPHWTVAATTSGPPYNGLMGIGWGMDNGYADFVNIAFRIFGPRVESLYQAYWLICVLSYLLFAIAYRRTAVPLILMAAAAVVQYIIFSSDVFWSAGQEWAASTNAHVHGPTGPRFLSSLCILPALHFLCATWGRESLRPSEVALLGLQGLILCLALQQRATVYWVVAAALLLAALHKFLLTRQADALQRRRRSLILVQLLAIVVLSKTFVAMNTHPGLSARGFMTGHTLWGSIYYSMQFHPDWKTRYSAEFEHADGDGVADFAWRRYVAANHLEEQAKEPTQAFIENMMKKSMIEFAKRDPKFVFDIYVFNNPRLVYEAAATVVKSVSHGIHAALPVLLIAFGLIFGWVSHRADSRLLFLSVPLIALLGLVSCLPNWATLPTSSSLTDFYVLMLITGIVSMISLGASGGLFLRSFVGKTNLAEKEPL